MSYSCIQNKLESHAFSRLYGSLFGRYVDHLIYLHNGICSSGKRDDFYITDSQLASVIGCSNRTIIRLRKLFIELKLGSTRVAFCRGSVLSTFYTLDIKLINELKGTIKTYFDAMQDYSRATYKEARKWVKEMVGYIISCLTKVTSCHGVKCHDVTFTIDEIEDNKENNNYQQPISDVVSSNKYEEQPKQPDIPQPTAGLAMQERALESKKEPLTSGILIRLSDDYLEGLDAKYFPRDLTDPLANSLMEACKHDKGLLDRFLKMGSEVCKWMVWNTAYNMREKGLDLNQAIRGTIYLIKKGTFGKPDSLTKHEKEQLSYRTSWDASLKNEATAINAHNAIKEAEADLYRESLTPEQRSKLIKILRSQNASTSQNYDYSNEAKEVEFAKNKERTLRYVQEKLKNKDVYNNEGRV